eukprot:7859032-Prorocentrum_lima.AAC.1
MDVEESQEGGVGEASTASGNVQITLPMYDEAMLVQYSKEKVGARIGELEENIAAIREDVNIEALAEFRRKEQDYLAR